MKWAGEREEDQLRLQKLLVKVRHVKDKMVQIKENKKKKEEEKKQPKKRKLLTKVKTEYENQLTSPKPHTHMLT